MTFFGMALLTAAGTIVLAAFAIVTAWYARRAFLKQSKEVSDQAEMLDLQRRQLAEQEKTSAKQAEVLGLQAKELRGLSRNASGKPRNGAEGRHPWSPRGSVGPVTDVIVPGNAWGATVRNASDLPVFDVRAAFHRVTEPVRGLGWTPVPAGTSLKSIRVLPPLSAGTSRSPPTSPPRTRSATTTCTSPASRSPTPRGTDGSATRAGR